MSEDGSKADGDSALSEHEKKVRSDLETQKIALDRYKANLDFWKFMGASVFAAIAIAAISPLFQWASAKLEDARKGRELSQTRAAFHDTYIKDFVEKAVGQDIELRIRLAAYFAGVSDDSYKTGWRSYHKELSDLRDKTREMINTGERQLFEIQESDHPDPVLTAEIKRKLAWWYGELGYSRPDRDVVGDPRTELADVGHRVDTINRLTDAQAIAVYKALAPSISSRRPSVQALLKGSDPNRKAASDGSIAKALLKMWVAVDGDPAFGTQVDAAIQSAQ